MKDFFTNRKKLFILGCIAVAIIIVGIIGVAISLSSMSSPMDETNTKYVNVTIESGSGTGDIGQALVDNGIIDSVTNFKVISKLKGYDGQFKAGVYALSPSMSTYDIADIIISGKVKSNQFTIPEGLTIFQAADKLAKEGIVDKKEFVDLLKNGKFNYAFLKNAQTGDNHLEGYLSPNTYQVAMGASSKSIITTMLEQFGSIFRDEYYARAKKLGYSVNDIIIVASIIERECGDVDREKVASVIYNRINEGMPLQMCSTVQYVLGKQKESLTDADTQIKSPYNTYVNQGLPPGPICSPGEASIKAALYPAKTDYLYFVVSEKLDGTHNFSSNYQKFLRDKDAYYAALNKQ